MPKQKIPISLLSISPKDPNSAGQAMAFFWAVCARCTCLHESVTRPKSGEHSTQGYGCAAHVISDGSQACGNYGSRFDDTYFAIKSSARTAIQGSDPLCDACLTELTLAGLAFPLDFWVQTGLPPEAFGTSTEDPADCARRELKTSLELLAAERGRLSH